MHDIDKMEKKSIGEIDYILDNDSNIISVKWNDNSVVPLLSSCHGVEPVKEAKRWSYAQKKHILILQPFNGKPIQLLYRWNQPDGQKY